MLADGNVIRGLRVQPGGRVDLPGQYGRVHVGLPYRCEIETLDLEEPGANTSDQLQSVSEITVKAARERARRPIPCHYEPVRVPGTTGSRRNERLR